MKNSFVILGLVLLASLFVGAQWDHFPALRHAVHSVLDPTFGVLLNWDVKIGFVIVTGIISLILTLSQKLLVNQKEMRELRAEQKSVAAQMKQYKDHPEKLMELQKKQIDFMGKTFHLTTRSLVVTMIPIILFYRWFREILNPIWGGWWVLYYIIAIMIFSSIFRKVLKVA